MTELAAPPVEQRTGVTRISHWIDGRSVAGESGRSSPVFNPATGKQTGALDLATEAEVDRAVQAAKQAFETWRTMSLAKRAELFFRIRELIHERREEVAKILTAEHGKVLSDALGEVTRGLEVI
jgi:malonate-semialdehyde dehydrogenase (acetylating)/methylmalonate-semialdehyde dehydrogenase